jgi:hypothetical protein
MKLFSFDTEDDSQGNPFLFNFYDVEKNQHHTFKYQDHAIDFFGRFQGATFWACNLEYDLNNLLKGYHCMVERVYSGSSLICASFKESRIKFYDTMRHWPMSVKDMGERIGLPKIEMEHKRTKNVTPEMVVYCRRDTEIVGRFVKQMTQVYDKIGLRMKATVASTTLDFFQREYYHRVNNDFSTKQIDFFHDGYYGGRSEIFFNKPVMGNIFYSDINSLYPSVMKGGYFPSIEHEEGDGHWKDMHKVMPNLKYEGMAWVTIKSPPFLNIPYLPCRIKDKLIFPLGKFQGVYTYYELRKALELGYEILACNRSIEFDFKVEPFTKYITDMYRMRLKAKENKDDLMQLTYKNLLNHLYGKFAQKNETTILLPRNKMRQCDCGGTCRFKYHLKNGDIFTAMPMDMNGLVLRKEKGDYPMHANCIWSAYVTAMARDRLYRALIKVEEAKGLLIYCDTDSVIYEAPSPILEDSKALGEFKLEGVYEYAHFKLPKLYCLRDKKTTIYKAKGIPTKQNNEGILTFPGKDYFETGKASFRKPNKLRESLRKDFIIKNQKRNLKPKKIEKLIPNYWELRDKECTGKYDKRIVDKNGFTTPIVIK